MAFCAKYPSYFILKLVLAMEKQTHFQHMHVFFCFFLSWTTFCICSRCLYLKLDCGSQLSIRHYSTSITILNTYKTFFQAILDAVAFEVLISNANHSEIRSLCTCSRILLPFSIYLYCIYIIEHCKEATALFR